MVGYKTSLFSIFTPKWLLIRKTLRRFCARSYNQPPCTDFFRKSPRLQSTNAILAYMWVGCFIKISKFLRTQIFLMIKSLIHFFTLFRLVIKSELSEVYEKSYGFQKFARKSRNFRSNFGKKLKFLKKLLRSKALTSKNDRRFPHCSNSIEFCNDNEKWATTDDSF